MLRLRRCLSSIAGLTHLATASEMATARSWLSDFQKRMVPKDGSRISFVRSSGPGGQNVNKLNTKAQLRVALTQCQYLPPYVVNELRRTPYYAANSDELLINASTHRSQAANADECYAKLKKVIVECATRPLKGETSPEQKLRVASLEKAHKRKLKEQKQHKSSIKQGRRKVDW